MKLRTGAGGCLGGWNRCASRSVVLLCITVVLTLLILGHASAQPSIVSVVPANRATGVSASAPVVFTFSAAMDTNLTYVLFSTYVGTNLNYYTTSAAWNSASNILTCTPEPAFMSPALVQWVASGKDLGGKSLAAPRQGSFSTGSGGGGGGGNGGGTNDFTTFIVSKIALYHQLSTAQPTLDTIRPFTFVGSTFLASNRNATNITLTLPNAAVSNLVANPLESGNWNTGAYSTNSDLLDTNFPAGTYTFNVEEATSNQTLIVSFPASLTFPGAPHLTNFVAAQSVDSTKPFTLYWEPFVGGGASDYVLAMLGTAWQTPNIGDPNALPGTATSATIPAGTLAAGQTYTASLGFAHLILATNGTDVTYVYRATLTEYSLTTASGTAAAPVVTNAAWSGGSFGFDLLTSPGQTVTVVSTTNVANPLASWPVLITTNTSGTSIHITDPSAPAAPTRYYRARNGT